MMPVNNEKVWQIELHDQAALCFFSDSGKGDVVIFEKEIWLSSEKLYQQLSRIKFFSGNKPIKLIGRPAALKNIRAELLKFNLIVRIDDVPVDQPVLGYFYGDSGRLRLGNTDSKTEVKSALPKIEVSTKKNVLIVDDSHTIQKVLSNILNQKDLEVAGIAGNVEEAKALLKQKKIDIVTLDIHMPGMDGLSYLASIKGQPHPPVVLISSISADDALNVFRCLELGAVDYIEKPRGNLLDEADRIYSVVSAAASAKIKRPSVRNKTAIFYSPKSGVNDLIAIGSSTGGVEAIREVLSTFPKNSPPVLIVQHIPAYFSKAFAERLNNDCSLSVKEAEDGDILEPGWAYIAPGGFQMRIKQSSEIRIQITEDPPVNRFKPSVDYLFKDLVKISKTYRISSALLTGMGKDGAEGLLALRQAGAHTIAESEETAVVYGMPREAVKLNAALEILRLEDVAQHLFLAFQKMKSKG